MLQIDVTRTTLGARKVLTGSAALLLACLATLATPLPARADLYLSPDNGATLTPLHPLPPNGFRSPVPLATPQSGLFQCSLPQVSVANTVSGYAIGNCSQGAHLERTSKSDQVPDTGKYYDGGYVIGSFQGCGWIETAQDAQVGDGVFARCPFGSVSINLTDFASSTDGCSGTSSCAGTPRTNPQQCIEYLNFRPWTSGQTLSPTGGIRTVPANSTISDGTPRLAWRYLARYPSSSGVNYAMIRDRGLNPGDGNWVFVNKNCMGL